MRALLGCFAEAFGEFETYCDNQPSSSYLAELLAEKTFFALVAVVDNDVVGGLCAYELRKFERERSEIYLYDLAVRESYRRRGIATALIAELKALASASGAWVVFVQADLGDSPAIALYGKLGVCEEVLHFDIPVE
jgi:aminoglycoside 3-N-acetyltransferase I